MNLATQVQTAVDTIDASRALEDLSARMSSGLGYFSLVLHNFQSGMPHTSGSLLSTALENVQPRILNPDKPMFGSDSWLVRQYAGINVAGAEQGTSIGLGYLAEFYIDFGLAGVVVGSFILGVILACSHAILERCAQSSVLANLGFMVLVFCHALVYDASLAKFGAAIVHKTIVFSALFYAINFLPGPHPRMRARAAFAAEQEKLRRENRAPTLGSLVRRNFGR
jgi:hypothetical protein